MDVDKIENGYLKTTKRFSLIVGTWPYQNQRRRWLLNSLVFILILVGFVTQVARVVVFFSVGMLLDQSPYSLVAIVICIKYANCIFNDRKFKELFVSILSDWNDKKTSEEEKIMDKYAARGAFIIAIYTTNAYFCGVVFFFVPFMPQILDTIMPMNESRPRVQMYPAYYFIENDDDYFYPIMLFTIATLLTEMCMFIAADTMLVYVVQHACGLLALAGHRFKTSLNEMRPPDGCCKVDDKKLYKNVCHGIKTHARAIAFLYEVEDVYAVSLFVQMGGVVLCFTLTLLKVATVTFNSETYPYYGYVIAQLVHIFFLTAQGQFVINLHDDVYNCGYDALWYNVHYKTQELFLLILRESLTPPLLTAGGLIELNFDTFAEILKTCVSYFTVLKSV